MMNPISRFGLLLVCILFSGTAFSAKPDAHSGHDHGAIADAIPTSWTLVPVIVKGGKGGERGVFLQVMNLAVTSLNLYSADQPEQAKAVPIIDEVASIQPNNPSKGGVHWIEAERIANAQRIRATTTWSFGSKGESPRALLATHRGGLEVVPERLPARYRENETWGFWVRFNGAPLQNTPVSFSTEHGTQQQLTTDQNGLVRISLAQDFDPAKLSAAPDQSRLTAQFVVSAEHLADGIQHRTSFNNLYAPDRMRQRSLPWGVGFFALGLALAIPLIRRREKKNA